MSIRSAACSTRPIRSCPAPRTQRPSAVPPRRCARLIWHQFRRGDLQLTGYGVFSKCATSRAQTSGVLAVALSGAIVESSSSSSSGGGALETLAQMRALHLSAAARLLLALAACYPSPLHAPSSTLSSPLGGLDSGGISGRQSGGALGGRLGGGGGGRSGLGGWESQTGKIAANAEPAAALPPAAQLANMLCARVKERRLASAWLFSDEALRPGEPMPLSGSASDALEVQALPPSLLVARVELLGRTVLLVGAPPPSLQQEAPIFKDAAAASNGGLGFGRREADIVAGAPLFKDAPAAGPATDDAGARAQLPLLALSLLAKLVHSAEPALRLEARRMISSPVHAPRAKGKKPASTSAKAAKRMRPAESELQTPSEHSELPGESDS
mmetsp:Transcript_19080/g.44518  ORF Transcript_19080/g.44518 Transcript_19080/m.44518 type:complete len:385 (+) Transcript_19080:246-1400(+)